VVGYGVFFLINQKKNKNKKLERIILATFFT
jgi:hypothetical protein